MIHDFGAGAFAQVVKQYQSNMADKLADIKNCAGQDKDGAVLWELQFVRNCSAQLGIVGVVAICAELAEAVLKGNALDYGALERVLGSAVDILNQMVSD
jgi:hypothetical protein